jgi:hypothetical protein
VHRVDLRVTLDAPNDSVRIDAQRRIVQGLAGTQVLAQRAAEQRVDVAPFRWLATPAGRANFIGQRDQFFGDVDRCAGWLAAADFHDLDRLLSRAYRLAKALPHELLHAWQKQVGSLNVTEREAIAKQRIGQDLFREGLITLWQGRCAITGLDEPALLRASHAKPWKDASDPERLDVYNGLLLAAHLDAAFDQGLITLDPSGNVVASPVLKPAALTVLDITAQELRVALAPQHGPYMQWHRNHVFGVR